VVTTETAYNMKSASRGSVKIAKIGSAPYIKAVGTAERCRLDQRAIHHRQRSVSMPKKMPL
jgi:hypothetical protein